MRALAVVPAGERARSRPARRRAWLVLLPLLGALGCGGTGSAPAQPVAPPAALTVLASSTSPLVGTAVTITASVVTAAGSPVASGTPVGFAVTGGVLSGVKATGPSGSATATLSSASGGTVTVTCSVGDLPPASVSVRFVDPDAPVRLGATAAPAAGLTGGRRPVVVTAQVERSGGGPVPAGTPVAFAVTAGAGTLSAATALTGPGGAASTTVNAAAEGPVTVVATAAAGVADAVEVAFTDPGKPLAVALFANPASGIAGGLRRVTLTAMVSPADPVEGQIADGTAVTFVVTAGSGTLSAASAGTLGGAASVELDAAAAGSVSVVARAGAAPVVASNGVTVAFAPQPPSAPAALTVLASSTSPLVGTPVTITASVVTADGSPVPSGTPVGFSATGGILAAVTPTGPAGNATATLTSAAAGIVTVTCSVGSLPARAVTLRFIDPNAPFAVALAASATRADVRTAVLLSATVRPAGVDGAGGAGGVVPDGTRVAFSASAGLLSSVTTTVGGVATAVLDGVLAPADVVVRASSGGVASPEATISFSDPDRPARLTVTAAPAAGFTGGRRPVVVRAHVERAGGGPVPAGTLVAFAVAAGPGSLSAGSALTGPDGDAVSTLDAATEGRVTVVAAVGGLSDGVDAVFTDPSKPLAVALFANPASGVTGGLRPVTFTAMVSPADPANGQIADGTPVTFTIVGGAGTLSATSDGTVNGVASVDLDAAVAGSVSVGARVGAAPAVDSNVVTVSFVVQPTVAVVTLRTVGSLPPGAVVGGISAVLAIAPADGLSCAAGDHVASGVGAGAMLVANPADLGNDRLALIHAGGMAPGEIATITCQVARGAFPKAQDFSVRLAAPGVIDLEGTPLAAMAVAIQGVDIR